MGTSSPKHILNLLSPGPGLLGTIINQIQLLKQLSLALKSHLPAPLDQHCDVAAVHQTTLVVHADSPAWATRLRYLAPALATSLRDQSGYQWIRDIKIKVRPKTGRPHAPAGVPARGAGNPGRAANPVSLQQVLQDVLAKRGPKA